MTSIVVLTDRFSNFTVAVWFVSHDGVGSGAVGVEVPAHPAADTKRSTTAKMPRHRGTIGYLQMTRRDSLTRQLPLWTYFSGSSRTGEVRHPNKAFPPSRLRLVTNSAQAGGPGVKVSRRPPSRAPARQRGHGVSGGKRWTHQRTSSGRRPWWSDSAVPGFHLVALNRCGKFPNDGVRIVPCISRGASIVPTISRPASPKSMTSVIVLPLSAAPLRARPWSC